MTQPTARRFLRCSGTLAKYGTPCPQKLLFFDGNRTTRAKLEQDVEIKCPRCGSMFGGKNWSAPEVDSA